MEPGFIVSVECVDAAALAGWLKGAPSVENLYGKQRIWRLQVEGMAVSDVVPVFFAFDFDIHDD